jgi:hypothetical protein
LYDLRGLCGLRGAQHAWPVKRDAAHTPAWREGLLRTTDGAAHASPPTCAPIATHVACVVQDEDRESAVQATIFEQYLSACDAAPVDAQT